MNVTKAELPTIQKTRSEIDRIYTPSKWGYVSANIEKSYTADCPTLAAVSQAYGQEYAVLWLTAQITALYAASPNKDKGMVDGIPIFCQTFLAEAKFYKLTELMLFFARYKSGRYDASFSTFDTRRIGVAFREFLKERNYELDRYEREAAVERSAKNRFIPPEGYSSLSWYQELKRRAAAGDAEAIAALRRPDESGGMQNG